VQVAAPTPHAAGRLLTIRPDVAKFLAVVALGERVLGFVSLYLDVSGTVKVKVKVILRLTVCQSGRLGVEPTLGLVTRFCFPLEGRYLNVVVLYLIGRPL
jgi:hypothetical protein